MHLHIEIVIKDQHHCTRDQPISAPKRCWVCAHSIVNLWFEQSKSSRFLNTHFILQQTIPYCLHLCSIPLMCNVIFLSDVWHLTLELLIFVFIFFVCTSYNSLLNKSRPLVKLYLTILITNMQSELFLSILVVFFWQ